ncbi:MAG TPA: MetQ/NlpA family ABC transporter substrate-binding protein [Bacillota bacterium]|nr:MetQ/NlpA family ABC transporter substrate-binding protein [Bacillota bacterium]
MKKWLNIVSTSILALSILAGCGSAGDQKSSTADGTKKEAAAVEKIKVGVTAGLHEEVMEKVKEVSAKDGLDIQIVPFNDYVQPNMSLSQGEIDANSFQHEPFLDQFKKDRNLDITKIANTINIPMGIYSSKIKDLKDLKDGAVLGLPNDPTNGARALQLFETAGLVKIKEGVGVKATVRDIAENPKHLQFKELEAPFVPQALGDLDIAAINTNYAMQHNLTPGKDSIFLEPKDSPWVNLIAVRTADKDKPVFQKLIKAYQSPEVKKFIEDKYKGSVIPSW